MLAQLQKNGDGYIARFERLLHHPAEQAWAWLTDNDKLPQWFPELRAESLREGGAMKFDMQDGTFEEMPILELKHGSLLEYTWGNDIVRFELTPLPDGCRLVLIEKIRELTNHTPKDLAGWHVCLDVVEALMDGRVLPERMEEWKKRYEAYAEAVRAFS